jgi:hypothetical protein
MGGSAEAPNGGLVKKGVKGRERRAKQITLKILSLFFFILFIDFFCLLNELDKDYNSHL